MGETDRILYVSDLDGTLLGEDLRLSDTSRDVINELVGDGLWFTVATGRSLPPTDLVLRGLDLRLPLILMNGALIFDPVTRRPIRRSGLAGPRAETLIRDQIGRGLHPFVFTIDAAGDHHAYHLGIFNACEERYVGNRVELGDKRFQVVDDLMVALDDQVMSIASIDSRERLTPVDAVLAAETDIYRVLCPDYRMADYWWLEVLSSEANKGSAVRFLGEYLGADRVVCFGDHANDLPMFAVADESYAMAGADEAYRFAATGVIAANSDDGVAHFLREAWTNAAIDG
jgi:5-amino-6-(5-phospho-D-ribitylamino)uracil phosphatase